MTIPTPTDARLRAPQPESAIAASSNAPIPTRSSAAALAAAGVCYAALVMVFWVPFGPWSGMPYETGFAYQSQTGTWWDGFFYGDPLRAYTNVFYHAAYLLSRGMGITGSFLPYQLVYAALWWGRGLISFAIFRRLLGSDVAAFLIGAFVVAHAADHALNWVGQLNQFGFIFWMLASFYVLLRAYDATRWWVQVAHTAIAAGLVYLSLWSYESQLFAIGAFPVLVLALFRRVTWRRILLTLAYWAVPAVYTVQNYLRYRASTGTYQQSVLRQDLSVGMLLSDLWFNVLVSVRFWDWTRPMVLELNTPLGLSLAAVAAAVFAVGLMLVVRLDDRWSPGPRVHEGIPKVADAVRVLLAGAVLLVASFPAYLILTSARMIWRTQFLSGLGTAMVLGAALLLVAAPFRRFRWGAAAIVAVGGAAVCAFGGWASYKTGLFHYRIWENHRQTIAQVLSAVPGIRDPAVIVLTDVHTDPRDPFGDVMWFDMALRLAYPGRQVAGIYYLTGDVPAPGMSLEVVGGRWRLTGKGYPPLVGDARIEDTVVVRCGGAAAGASAQVLAALPPFVTSDPQAAERYDPRQVIIADAPVTDVARRRYGPNPSPAAW